MFGSLPVDLRSFPSTWATFLWTTTKSQQSNVYVSVDKKTETLSMLSVCFDSVHSSMCHSCYLCKIPFLRYLKIALLGGGGIKICNPAFNAVVLLFSQFSPLCRENCFCSLLQPVPLLASHDFFKKSFFGIFFFTLLLLCDELQSGSVSHSSQLLSQSAYCTWRILCNLHTVWMPIILQHSQRATGPEKNT